ncbi:MAG: transposase, partial [Candidatus Taylorbacteria bacterium]|nr:transposase [Candidatus Taylorbacteria bacterium]
METTKAITVISTGRNAGFFLQKIRKLIHYLEAQLPSMRNLEFTTGEFYHLFNRGNNKRGVFLDKYDLNRFFLSMREFNTYKPIGSIYEQSFKKEGADSTKNTKLVDFICYCLNPNHFHFALKQLKDDGITKFMHRLGTGYTKYFNQRHENSGALFQGRYKAKHIDSNEYLLHLSAYINLNPEAHQLGSSTSKSSWEEYINPNSKSFC